ncbi:hypothetical protein ACS0TY_005282 [Phlomoides rotata]
MKFLSSNPVATVWLIVMLMCALGFTQRVEGQSQLEQCLTGCTQIALTCFLDCGISRGGTGTVACYRGCGAQNITCLISCFGSQVPPNPNY